MARPVDDRLVEQHDVGVERAARIARHVAPAAVSVLERMQPGIQRGCIEIGVEADREIEEIRPFEADSRRAVDRRHGKPAEARAKLGDRAAQMDFRIDVGAEAEIGAMHVAAQPRRPRSMTTPTARAPRTAPGLDSLSRSHCTPNSSRISAAQRSASVSTSWKLEASDERDQALRNGLVVERVVDRIACGRPRVVEAHLDVERDRLARAAFPVVDADDGVDAQVFDEDVVHGVGIRDSGFGMLAAYKVVIPAKAGIQLLDRRDRKELGPGLRRDDGPGWRMPEMRAMPPAAAKRDPSAATP